MINYHPLFLQENIYINKYFSQNEKHFLWKGLDLEWDYDQTLKKSMLSIFSNCTST